MLKIITHPNKILRQKSRPAVKADLVKIKKMVAPMLELMKTQDGAGLAAPQVGENIRLIVMAHKDGDLVLINPEIIKKSLLKEWGEEGCLSVPGRFGEVLRHKKVKIKYLDLNFCPQALNASGLLARVAQHEIDHLAGILFIDKARRLSEPAAD